MKRSIVITLFVLMSFKALAQNQRKLDSLREAFSTSKTDTGRVHTLIEIAYYYMNETNIDGKLDTAERYIKEARELNKKHNTVEFQNQMNVLSASIYCWRNPNQDPKNIFLPVIAGCSKTEDRPNEMFAWQYLAYFIDPNEASNQFRLICYQKVMALAHQLNKGDDEMDALKQIADIHTQQKKFGQAESELFQVIKETKKTGSRTLMFAYDLLAWLYIKKGEYNNALFYALKTEKSMQTTGDSVVAITFYGRLATIYRHLGRFSSSIEWQKKSLGNLIATKEFGHVFLISSAIATDYISEGKASDALKFISNIAAKYKPTRSQDKRYVQKALGDCYSALKDYALAEKSYLEMISLMSQEKGNELAFDQANDYAAIGNFYLDRKDFHKAQKYLMTALNAWEREGTIANLKDVHLSLFKVDSALGDYQSAIRHLQLNNRFKDSIFNTARNNQVEELNIRYQTDEREKDLKLSRDKVKLEQIQLERTQNGRNWIIAASALLLIIAGLLYRQSRLRRRNNELITHKNELLQHLLTEKEWLLKEVHHRVKNNLHTVICLLESQARYLENDALKAIENSQHRIYAMSLIHQKLYQSDDIKTINMAEYIPELVNSLEEGFDTSNQIKYKLTIKPVNLNISHAIPLGLIINEAVTNSIKYAFPNNRKGEIAITMLREGDRVKLELADNGIGMPRIDFGDEPESMGLRLMKGLSEDIDADITFEVENGTRIIITFGYDTLNEPENLLKAPQTKEIHV